MDKKQDHTARQIVAHLILRNRAALRRLRRAQARGVEYPAEYVNMVQTEQAEAHNAAECACRILYHGAGAL